MKIKQFENEDELKDRFREEYVIPKWESLNYPIRLLFSEEEDGKLLSKILILLTKRGWSYTSELTEDLGTDWHYTRRRVNFLRRLGLIIRVPLSKPEGTDLIYYRINDFWSRGLGGEAFFRRLGPVTLKTETFDGPSNYAWQCLIIALLDYWDLWDWYELA